MGELWGITGDGWVAIATLAGGLAVLVGISVGVWQASIQLEAGDVRRFVFDDGVLALKSGLDNFSELTRLNHGLMVRLLKHTQLTRGDRLAALRVGEIPRVIPDRLPSFNSHGITPAAVLTGFARMGELMTRAFSQLYTVNVNMEIGLRHRILNFYSQGMPNDVDVDSWIDGVLQQAGEEYILVDRFCIGVSGLLLQAVMIAQEKRLRRFRDISRVRDSADMQKVAMNLGKLLDEASNAQEQYMSRRSTETES